MREDEVTELNSHDTAINAGEQTDALSAAAGIKKLMIEAVRTCVFLPPRWQGLPASAQLIAALFVLELLVLFAFQRLMIVGQANFYWQAILTGWFCVAIQAWVCYLLRPMPTSEGSVARTSSHLLTLFLAQALVLDLVFSALDPFLIKIGAVERETMGLVAQWWWYLLPIGWTLLAELTLLWRAGNRKPASMILTVILLTGSITLCSISGGPQFWYPAQAVSAEAEPRVLELSQELMEAQPVLLARRLADLKEQRPGVIDVYTITFAPYADENVFLAETAMVSQVMAKRFDAAGRGIELVNHIDTLAQHPWATRLNLQRSIQQMAKQMDLEEDVLFLHLSSHGASDGKLSASFWPLSVDTLTPDDLRTWLENAGIKNRVISVSACYSGNWIAPLSNENTLIMTASDADHTSYGCGSKSDLTFFGRAMYDEQLRNNTLSFEMAHAAARPIIKQREEKEGKDDGYSNPQIKVGNQIRQRLSFLQKRLEKNTLLTH